MAQWTYQYLGFTHETKVLDAEISLRKAIETLSASPVAERTKKMKDIRRLVERLLTVRIKAARAEVSALSEPGAKKQAVEQAAHLQARVVEMESQGVEEILKEFDV